MCTVCGGDLAIRFPAVTDPESGEQFEIHACRTCGLGHTLPKPKDLEPFYAPAYYGGRHGLTADLCLRRRFNLLRKHSRRPGTLVDMGCGDGSFLELCQRQGWGVSGTERGRALSMGRSAPFDVREDLSQLAHRAPFTAATAWHSLEHLEDPLRSLRTLRSLMSDDGTLIVAVPNFRSLQAIVFRNTWFHLDVPRHLHHFDGPSLTIALESSGFSVVAREHGELEYDLFGWIQSALDLCLPRRTLFHRIVGKPVRTGAAAEAASLALGALVGTPALSLTLLEKYLGRAGTLVIVARCSEGS